MKGKILVLTIILFAVSYIQAQVRIKMKNENGVFTTPCTVNGLKLRFIFDTGASNVCISLSEALFMLKNGYLAEEDIHGSSYSQIANGDLIKNTTVTLKELEIGGKKVYNIEALIIHELDAPLLLGQTAIQKLGRIELKEDELVIFDAIASDSKYACDAATEAILEASKYYKSDLFLLSANTYQSAYDICPDAFSCFDLYEMGISYNNCNNYETAINFFEMVIGCPFDNSVLWHVYSDLSSAYCEIGNYDNAVLNIQKAMSIVYKLSDETYLNDLSLCYNALGLIYMKENKYKDAEKQLKSSLFYYVVDLKELNLNAPDFKIKYDTEIINISKGKVKNDMLGEIYWNIAVCNQELEMISAFKVNMVLSALCGYSLGIDYCNNNGLDYIYYSKKLK